MKLRLTARWRLWLEAVLVVSFCVGLCQCINYTSADIDLTPGSEADLRLIRLYPSQRGLDVFLTVNSKAEGTAKLQLSMEETHSKVILSTGKPGFYPEKTWRQLPHVGFLTSRVSHIHVSVLEVDAPLVGEKAEIQIDGPIGIMSVEFGYIWLWPFLFWQLFAAILGIWGLILLAQELKSVPAEHQPD